MTDLPVGTVTYLFTDVEGSTRLWEQAAVPMREAMARHDTLVEGCVSVNEGQLVRPRGEGDSRFAVFAHATDALAAARDIQLALSAEPWVTPRPVRVRIAIHTGQADLRAGDYYGSDVNRCARLRAIASGGQTLLSQATFDLVRDSLPPQVTLRDLGEHRLKDLQRSEHVYQLIVAGLQTDFPPLQSIDALPNNLPVQLTSFVGRERELTEVKQLLSSTHLLTLTGPGGTGKTRLALQVAADILETWRDGVWFIELAALADPALVPQSVSAELGVQEQPGRTFIDSLVDYLRGKEMLLLLDNCEHLIDACAQIADRLLRACPKVRILATSREALGITGETAWAVPPLSLPALHEDAPVEMLTSFESIRLFVDRALAAQPTFTLTQANARFVFEICQRLDGIPLAIELAAARVKVLSPQQIAARLDDRFRLLTGGSRTALPRQQTLHALIDWSYDLLPEAERVLLRRLAMFAGGWTLEAAEGVCADQEEDASTKEGIGSSFSPVLHPAEILDLLTQLVNKSLVMTDERAGDMRYRMLETIRQYAQEKLKESGEISPIRNRHLDYFALFVESIDHEVRGTEQETWLQRLDNDYDNIRAALEWSKHRPEVELRLAATLFRFWRVRSYFSEGRRWLKDALARGVDVPPLVRARALMGAGSLANYQGDYPQAQVLLAQALALSRQAEDKPGIAMTLNLLTHAEMMTGDFDDARSALDESLAIFEELDDKRGMGYVYFFMGSMFEAEGELSQARQVLERSLELLRQVGDRWWIGNALLQLAWGINRQGDHGQALALLYEVLTIAESFNDKRAIARALMYIAEAKFYQGDYQAAHQKYLEALALFQEIGDKWWGTVGLEGFAAVLAKRGEPERVVRLLGAAERLHEIIGAPLLAAYRETIERTLAYAHGQLDDTTFNQWWSEGRALTFDQAIESAKST